MKANGESHSRKALRVFVIEASSFVRQGVIDFLAAQPNIRICGFAPAVAEALPLLQKAAPDFAIVDLEADSFAALDQIKATLPNLALLAFSNLDEDHYALRCLRAGMRGFLRKNSAPQELLGALRTIQNGRLFVSESIHQKLLADSVRVFGSNGLNPQSPSPFAPNGARLDRTELDGISRLTRREREVLEAISVGLTTREIAAKLNLSGKTIETYRENLKSKLNFRNARELVAYARQNAFSGPGPIPNVAGNPPLFP